MEIMHFKYTQMITLDYINVFRRWGQMFEDTCSIITQQSDSQMFPVVMKMIRTEVMVFYRR